MRWRQKEMRRWIVRERIVRLRESERYSEKESGRRGKAGEERKDRK